MIGYALRLLRAYIIKNRRIFAGGLIIGLAVALSYIYLMPRIPKPTPTTTIGLAGNYTMSNLPLAIQKKLSFGLDDAAASYEATDSGKTWFFKIKPGIFWQDGKPLTAKDINYKLADVTITPVDEQTVRFDLASPYAPLPSIVNQPLFRPGLIGLGSYKLLNVKNSGRFLQNLEISNGAENIIYKFYPTDDLLHLAFKLGEIKEIQTLNLGDLGQYKNGQTTDYSLQVVAFFNTRSGNTADKSFRQALLYALDGPDGDGSPSAGPIAPTSWAYSKSLKIYPHNLDDAKKLLEKTTATESAKLKIASTIDLTSVAHKLKKDWEALGMTVETETSETVPEDFDVYLTTVEIPADPDQYQLWHSTSPTNVSGYKSPKSDKLIEDGRQETDKDKRKAIYADWQKAITEDAPAAFLYFPYIYTISRD